MFPSRKRIDDKSKSYVYFGSRLHRKGLASGAKSCDGLNGLMACHEYPKG